MIMTPDDVKLFQSWQGSPSKFVTDVWGLTPQELKPEHKEEAHRSIGRSKLQELTVGQFLPFKKGDEYTWHQWIMLLAVELAIQGKAPQRISIASGHGIGKSTALAWLVIWYLICFMDAQVPCTAPSSHQMDDVLWKEIAKWIDRMPEWLRVKLEWTSGYVRVTERPDTWFARARTARPEKPEAFAGVHGDYVMYIADEASGIADPIFNTLEGALTGPNVLMVMPSNPTRLQGYFYDSHHSDRENWQTLQFSSKDSPIVDERFVRRILEKNGEDSDEYRIRVLGLFPKADSVDEKGFTPLLKPEWIRETSDANMTMLKRLGVDPAGQGADKATWVERDAFKIHVLGSEQKSTPKGIAQKTALLMEGQSITENNVVVDSFGIGGDSVKELALDKKNVRNVNVGEPAQDPERFANIRAEMYWRMREWLMGGGEIVAHPDLKKELLSIRFKRNLGGKIQLMSKEDMRKIGLPSPNFADAAALTFVDGEIETIPDEQAFVPEAML